MLGLLPWTSYRITAPRCADPGCWWVEEWQHNFWTFQQSGGCIIGNMAGIIMLIGSDGWLVVTGTMEFYDFPFSWECHKNIIIPTDDLHHFQGGRSTTNQMGTIHKFVQRCRKMVDFLQVMAMECHGKKSWWSTTRDFRVPSFSERPIVWGPRTSYTSCRFGVNRRVLELWPSLTHKQSTWLW